MDEQAEAARIGAACDEHIKRARRKAALDAMRAIDAVAQLPDGLEPGEKGALLLEYVRHGTPVDGLDFSMVLVPKGTDLSDAHLKGGRFRQGVFEGVRLDGADLRGAELRHARAAGVSLDRALLHEADLRHVDFKGGALRDAELHRARADHVRLVGADLTGADLRDSDLRSPYLRDAIIDDANLRGALINAEVARRAGWAAETVVDLRREHGVRLESLDEFPMEVRRQLAGDHEGLTLFLSTLLLPWDQTMLHAYVCTLLGTDTDVRVAEYIEDAEGQSCRLRLVGNNLDDLVLVAERLAAATWRAQEQSALQAAGLLRVDELLTSLDHTGANIEKMELWVREQQDTAATNEIARVHLRRSWLADALQAGKDHLLAMTKAKGLIEAGVRGIGNTVDAVATWKDDRDLSRWEASVAQQELDEEGE